MTPEEMNTTIEFIIQSQARLAAAQEQDREERIQFDKWSKEAILRLIELANIQSSRLDRAERAEQAAQGRHEQLLKEVRDEMREGFKEMRAGFDDMAVGLREVRAALERILGKLPDRLN